MKHDYTKLEDIQLYPLRKLVYVIGRSLVHIYTGYLLKNSLSHKR